VCLTTKGEIVAIFNSQKIGPFKNWSGTSKAMEGFGVEEICKELKAEGLFITSFIHDDDSCTANLVRQYFGETTIEFLELTQEMIDRIANSIRFTWLTFKSKIDVSSNFSMLLHHWQDIHMNCSHTLPYSRHYPPHKLSTNSAESYNSLFARLCPKASPQPLAYSTLSRTTVLQKDQGKSYLKDAMESMNLPLDPVQVEKLSKLRKKREYFKSYKEKSLCKCHGGKSGQPCATRQCTCLKSSNSCSNQCDCNAGCANPFNSTLSPEKILDASVQNILYCCCKKGEPVQRCSNRKCGCVRFGGKCNSKCSCRNECLNCF